MFREIFLMMFLSSDFHRTFIGLSSDFHRTFGLSSDLHRTFGLSSDFHRTFIGLSYFHRTSIGLSDFGSYGTMGDIPPLTRNNVRFMSAGILLGIANFKPLLKNFLHIFGCLP